MSKDNPFGFTPEDLKVIEAHQSAERRAEEIKATLHRVAQSLVAKYQALSPEDKVKHITEGTRQWQHAERFGWNKANAFVDAIAQIDADMGLAVRTALDKARKNAIKTKTNGPLGPTDTDNPELIAIARDRDAEAAEQASLNKAIEENVLSIVHLWNTVQDSPFEEIQARIQSISADLVRDKTLGISYEKKISTIRKHDAELAGILEKEVEKILNDRKKQMN